MEWEELDNSYCGSADRFWDFAAALLETTSPTLKSLSLFAIDGWFADRFPVRSRDRNHFQKVLGCISGISFPNLVYLAVDHDAQEEISGFSHADEHFEPIDTPRLRRLHIRSMDVELYSIKHPLLDKFPDDLVNVSITGGKAIDKGMRVIYGDDWRELTADKCVLPGKVRSLVLRQDFIPCPRSLSPFSGGNLDKELRQELNNTRKDIKDVEKLHIDGLETRLPYWSHLPGLGIMFIVRLYWTLFPAAEQKHYEQLVQDHLEVIRSDVQDDY